MVDVNRDWVNLEEANQLFERKETRNLLIALDSMKSQNRIPTYMGAKMLIPNHVLDETIDTLRKYGLLDLDDQDNPTLSITQKGSMYAAFYRGNMKLNPLVKRFSGESVG